MKRIAVPIFIATVALAACGGTATPAPSVAPSPAISPSPIVTLAPSPSPLPSVAPTPAPPLTLTDIQSIVRAGTKALEIAQRTDDPSGLSPYLTGRWLSDVTSILAGYKASGLYDDYTSEFTVQKILSNTPDEIIVQVTETMMADDVLRDVQSKSIKRVLSTKGTKFFDQINLRNENGVWKMYDLLVLPSAS